MSGEITPPDEPTAQPLIGFAAQRAAALAIAGVVRSALDALLAPADLRIYATSAFAAALRGRVREHRRLHVRLLVPDGLTRNPRGGALWRLVQDLPSFLALRVLAEPLLEGEPTWLVADRGIVLFRRYPGGADGEYDAHHPRRARALRERFETLWTESQPDVELRRLSL